MSARNPRYIKDGLNPTEALLIATQFAWVNALADLVVYDSLSQASADHAFEAVKNVRNALMIDKDVVFTDDGQRFAIDSANKNFRSFGQKFADDLDDLGNLMEAQEETNVAAN